MGVHASCSHLSGVLLKSVLGVYDVTSSMCDLFVRSAAMLLGRGQAEPSYVCFSSCGVVHTLCLSQTPQLKQQLSFGLDSIAAVVFYFE